MKRFLIISSIATLIFVAVILITAIVFSFVVIKPTVESINKNLASEFSKVVAIPTQVTSLSQFFDETTYKWEMETPEKEIVGVIFKHTTGFSKDQNLVQATLTVPEGGDISLFSKVLPAIIVDRQSLYSAENPQKANLEANQEALYNSIAISTNAAGQTKKITWTYDKANFNSNLLNLYSKLKKFPEPILRILFSLLITTLNILGSQA